MHEKAASFLPFQFLVLNLYCHFAASQVQIATVRTPDLQLGWAIKLALNFAFYNSMFSINTFCHLYFIKLYALTLPFQAMFVFLEILTVTVCANSAFIYLRDNKHFNTSTLQFAVFLPVITALHFKPSSNLVH